MAATTTSHSLAALLFLSSSPFPKPSSVSVLHARLICRGELAGVKARAVASSSPKPKGEPRGIMKPRRVSPEMQALVGVPEISRTQALKRIWAHIKENNLQDPNDKKVIICDEKLKKIFGGKDRVGFLEIAGLIRVMFMDIMALFCLVLIALFCLAFSQLSI